MCHLVLAYDSATSIAVYSHTDGQLEDLPFPVAALLCSLSTFANQSGWQLQDVSLEDCNMGYHRGSTGLVWLMITNNLLLQHEHIHNMLQVADTMVQLLLGQGICRSRLAVIKQHFKGVGAYLDDLFQPNQQLSCPLAPLLLPHQTMLQPSPAAAGLPQFLQQVTAAAGEQATAAVLQSGRYCCASPSWQQDRSRLQQLVLQLIAAAHGQQQAGHGKLTLHIPSSFEDAEETVQLMWCNLQPNVQLCLLASSNYSLQQFMLSTQQLLASHSPGVEIEPLQLPDDVLAVAVVDGACNWATYNARDESSSSSSCWWQVAAALAHEQGDAVLLHTGGQTVAVLPAGGCKAYLHIEGSISIHQAQELVCMLPAVLLGA